jgi:hypothetical protein
MTRPGSAARILTAALVVVALGSAPLASARVTHDPAQPAAKKKTKNLILNPGAEAGAGSSTGAIVHIPNWNPTGATAVTYGATGGGGFPTAQTPGPTKRGVNFFAGGPHHHREDVESLEQTVALDAYAGAIDAGHVKFTLSGWLGGTGSDTDSAVVYLVFYSASQQFLSSATLGPVTAADRSNVTKLLSRTAKAQVPATARSVLVDVEFDGGAGNYNNAYADNLSLVLTGV